MLETVPPVLQSIRLTSIEFELGDHDLDSEPSVESLVPSIGHTPRLNSGPGPAELVFDHHFRLQPKTNDGAVIFLIHIHHDIDLLLPDGVEVDPTDEATREFAWSVVTPAVWPYLRQLTHQLLVSSDMPPLMLPVLRGGVNRPD